MTTEQKEQLERFTAAALIGLCANQEFLRIAAKIDGESNHPKGTSLSAFSLNIGSKTAKLVEKYVNEQSANTPKL